MLARIGPDAAHSLRFAWRDLWARPAQLAPGSRGSAPMLRGKLGLVEMLRGRTPPIPEFNEDWKIWTVLGGRGSGKTRPGAEWVIEQAQNGPQPPIALVGATAADVRDVMVCQSPQPDQSGIIAISEPGFVPRYFPSLRKLVWPNGVTAYLYSAEEPERLRGPQHGKAWADDVAAWHPTTRDATWNMLMFGLRLGQKPQVVATTTPKPIPWLVGGRKGKPPLGILNDPSAFISRMRTEENCQNLAPDYYADILKRFGGTRLGRQELDAEVLLDVEGALWTINMFDELRLPRTALDGIVLRRIVVAIDPQTSEGTNRTDQPEEPETGIVVAGVGDCACKGDGEVEEHGFVLEDCSGSYSPNAWAKRALEAYDDWKADIIIAEANQGGAMVEETVRTVRRNASIGLVHASRGKRTRAEPVASVYAQKKVHHIGEDLVLLEDQCCTWDGSGPSPNRMDACLVAGTLVTLVRGAVPIEDVRAGDLAWTRDGWRPVLRAAITSPLASTVSVETSDGRVLRGTGNHPVWVEGRGFVPLDSLVCGDMLLNASRRLVLVAVVRRFASAPAPVWNLEVAETPEYFANGLLVHNCVWALAHLVVLGEESNAELYMRAKLKT